MSEPRPPETPEADDGIARSVKAAAILGAAFSLAALGLYGARAACSVLVGAAIAIVNLVTMRAIVRALVRVPKEHEGAERRGGVAWGLFAALKMLLLFGGIWILLTRQLVDPMPLVVGYGVLPLGIAASALWSSLRS